MAEQSLLPHPALPLLLALGLALLGLVTPLPLLLPTYQDCEFFLMMLQEHVTTDKSGQS